MGKSFSVCRSCGKDSLELILSLGKTPLANSLLAKEQLNESESTYPLDLAFCPDCSLVQITETVPPEKLFGEYLYFSSFSDTMLRHAQQLVERLINTRQLSEDSLVIEIASNDGYLLQYYHKDGVPVLGIEPAVNIAKVAQNERGIRTLCEFFDDKLAEQLREQGEMADVVHAHNVLAHVANLNGFVLGIKLVLKNETDIENWQLIFKFKGKEKYQYSIFASPKKYSRKNTGAVPLKFVRNDDKFRTYIVNPSENKLWSGEILEIALEALKPLEKPGIIIIDSIKIINHKKNIL